MKRTTFSVFIVSILQPAIVSSLPRVLKSIGGCVRLSVKVKCRDRNGATSRVGRDALPLCDQIVTGNRILPFGVAIGELYSCVVAADGYKFATSHEWTGLTNSSSKETVVGISEFAQNQLGDIVYVELPEVGHELAKGDTFGVVESVKAASDVFSPISGSVVAVNEKLNDEPQLVNKAPYSDGWIMKVKYSAENEMSDLMGTKDYDTYVKGLAE